MNNDDIVIMIPAYNPDEKLLDFLQDLINNNFKKIIIINDGSRRETLHFFDTAEKDYGCRIVKHSINLGQGRAYKSGFNCYLSECCEGGIYNNTIGVIQCDCDGQHHIEDIKQCSELLRSNPGKFILGVRDFSDRNIPFRSRFGNNLTAFVFKFFCGLDIKDTQTGLKGIPASFIPTIMETPGERFEYASSVLLETKRSNIEILQFPIKTIYINGNETSHFNPLIDSVRIYSLILKYFMSSLSAFIVDIIAFSLFLTVLKGRVENYIIISTYMAKVISCTYSFFVNKSLVFENKGKYSTAAVKFIVLCIVQATLSGVLVDRIVNIFGWYEVISKVIIDTLLFFASFQIQNRWVFKNGNKN